MNQRKITYWSGAALLATAVCFGATLSATAQDEVEASAAEAAEQAADPTAPVPDETTPEARRRRARGEAGERDRPRGGREGGFGRGGFGRGGEGRPSPGEGPGLGRRGQPGPQGPPADAGRLFDLFDVDEDGQLSRAEFRRMTEAARIFRAMVGRGRGQAHGPHPPGGQLGQQRPGFDRPELPGGRGPRRGPPGDQRPPRRDDESDS